MEGWLGLRRGCQSRHWYSLNRHVGQVVKKAAGRLWQLSWEQLLGRGQKLEELKADGYVEAAAEWPNLYKELGLVTSLLGVGSRKAHGKEPMSVAQRVEGREEPKPECWSGLL